MRLFLFFIFITVLTGCTAIEVAKEITKASNSVKKTVTSIIKNEDKSTKTNETLNTLDTYKKTTEIGTEIDNLTIEIETLKTEKKKEKNIAIKQKKVVVVNFLGKTLDHLINNLGTPNLFRIDGNTEIARFDSSTCRIFFFFNKKQNIKEVKYFEIRDNKGNLIDIKDQIEECYKDFKLI